MANRSFSLSSSAVAAVILLLILTSLPAAISHTTRRTSTCNSNNNNNAIAMLANTGSTLSARTGAWRGIRVPRGGGGGGGERRGTFNSERTDHAASGWAGVRTSGRSPVRGRGGARSLRCVCAVPPLGISPLGWDTGMGTVCLAASVVWVKLWTSLARHGKIKPQVSRKVVHATAAPLFMVLWPFFTARPCARFFAAGVPLAQAMRLTVAGLSGDADNEDASSNELVAGISRSGRASEALGGPLKYALALVALTAVEWRTSVVGVVAILQLAVGDGMADLVGRKVGRHKWKPGGDKSVEGSFAFASSAFLASMGLIGWFHRFGALAVSPADAAVRVAGISVACAAVELLPPRVAGDDNVSIPVTAIVAGRLLF